MSDRFTEPGRPWLADRANAALMSGPRRPGKGAFGVAHEGSGGRHGQVITVFQVFEQCRVGGRPAEQLLGIRTGGGPTGDHRGDTSTPRTRLGQGRVAHRSRGGGAAAARCRRPAGRPGCSDRLGRLSPRGPSLDRRPFAELGRASPPSLRWPPSPGGVLPSGFGGSEGGIHGVPGCPSPPPPQPPQPPPPWPPSWVHAELLVVAVMAPSRGPGGVEGRPRPRADYARPGARVRRSAWTVLPNISNVAPQCPPVSSCTRGPIGVSPGRRPARRSSLGP